MPTRDSRPLKPFPVLLADPQRGAGGGRRTGLGLWRAGCWTSARDRSARPGFPLAQIRPVLAANSLDLITHSPRRGDAWTVRLKARSEPLAGTDRGALHAGPGRLVRDQLVRELQGLGYALLGDPGSGVAALSESLPRLAGRSPPDAGLPALRGLGRCARSRGRPGPLASGGAGPCRSGNGGRCCSRERLGPKCCQARAGPNTAGSSSPRWERVHGRARPSLPRANSNCSTRAGPKRPDYILGLVRGYLRSIGQSNPLENQRRLTEERVHLTEQCRQRLGIRSSAGFSPVA